MRIVLLLLLLCSCNSLKPRKSSVHQCVTDTVLVSEHSVAPRLMKLPRPSDDWDGYENNFDKMDAVIVGSAMEHNRRQVWDRHEPSAVREKVKVQKQEGTLVYDVPSTMYVETQYPIRVRINREIGDTSIREGIKVSGSAVVRTSEVMEVELIDPSGKMFDIVRSSDRQVVEEEGYTEWLFTVTPLTAGNGSLNVVVSVILDGNKKQKVYEVEVDVKTVPVIIIKGFWERHWQWVVSTFLIPLGLWVYEKRKKIKQHDN